MAIARGHGTAGGADAPPYREAVVTTGAGLILDPLLARQDPASRDAAHLTHRALLRLDSRVAPVPDLAATYSISGDGLAWRFQLGSTAWSRGGRVTAADVAATVSLAQRADLPDQSLAAAWHGVTAAPDGESAITLTLPSARASFAAQVADLPILPAAVALQPTPRLVAAERAPIPGTGAYEVTATSASLTELVARAGVSPAPHLDRLQLVVEPDFSAAEAAIAQGRVDAVEATTPGERAALAGLPGLTLHDTTSLRFVDLLLNTRRTGLDDVAVRRALATAVDRATLIRAALGGAGRPQVDAEPVGILWLGPMSTAVPDPVLAGRALDAAGWTVPAAGGVRTKGGDRLAFTLSVTDTAPLPAVAREVARQLGSIGVAVTVAPVTADAFSRGVLGGQGYDMAVADWDNGPDPDISTYWRSNAAPPAGENVSGLAADPFLDRALDDLATARDPQLRAEAAARVQQRLAGAVPAVFLYAPTSSFVTSARLTDVGVPAAGVPGARYDGISTWRLRP